jgi:hypothetical protein
MKAAIFIIRNLLFFGRKKKEFRNEFLKSYEKRGASTLVELGGSKYSSATTSAPRKRFKLSQKLIKSDNEPKFNL